MKRIRFDSEPELRDQLSKSLSEYGWRVETEVYSVCKTGRADVPASHPQAGTFGLEIKYMQNYSGKKLGEAMKQVERYRRLGYDDWNVDYWAILPRDGEHPIFSRRNWEEHISFSNGCVPRNCESVRYRISPQTERRNNLQTRAEGSNFPIKA